MRVSGHGHGCGCDRVPPRGPYGRDDARRGDLTWDAGRHLYLKREAEPTFNAEDVENAEGRSDGVRRVPEEACPGGTREV